jgi:response regulator NasT
VTERAKGILMERHSIGERQAFEMLRDQSRRSGRKLVDIAMSILEGHLLLPPARERDGAPDRAGRSDGAG